MPLEKPFYFNYGLKFDMGNVPMLQQTLVNISRLDSLEF